MTNMRYMICVMLDKKKNIQKEKKMKNVNFVFKPFVSKNYNSCCRHCGAWAMLRNGVDFHF